MYLPGVTMDYVLESQFDFVSSNLWAGLLRPHSKMVFANTSTTASPN